MARLTYWQNRKFQYLLCNITHYLRLSGSVRAFKFLVRKHIEMMKIETIASEYHGRNDLNLNEKTEGFFEFENDGI